MSKTILITGATSGFGEAMAHVFAAAGNKLIITGRKESLLLALKETLVAKHNTSVHTLCFDVQNKEAVFAAISIYKKRTSFALHAQNPLKVSKRKPSSKKNF